jgi:reprolysin-like metallo-peptidase family M12B
MIQDHAFALKDPDDVARDLESQLHVLGKGIICDTDSRGYSTPDNRDPLDLVVDASEGFIPLWARDVTLRWRFQQRSLSVFVDPVGAADAIRRLLGEALLRWGDAAPVKFAQNNDAWDFEIVVSAVDDCSPNGCVLASAFFPDAGRHELTIYPKMFTQSEHEQVDTLIHEIGHTFGLRHFFAQLSESAWPSEIFGEHQAFSIMNYGSMSELTAADRTDLAILYQQAWSGQLTQINGTPVRLLRPFSSLVQPTSATFAFAPGNRRPGHGLVQVTATAAGAPEAV